MGTDELIVRIPGGEEPWGVLVLAGAMQLGPDDGARLAGAIARTLGVLVRGASATEQATSRLRRTEALRRVATDLASRLDVGDVVRDLSDHARVLFGADRVAVVLRDAEGRISSPGGTGFSDEFLAVARDLEEQRAASRRHPAAPTDAPPGPDAPTVREPDPRGRRPGRRRHAPASAPLVRRPRAPGVLYRPHDRAHRWREDELEPLRPWRATPRSPSAPRGRSARMAAWAAQLQSIQRLGARLSASPTVARDRLTPSPPSSASSSTTTTPASTGSRATTSSRSRCRARWRVRRRDARPAPHQGRRGHHGLGRRAPRRPAADDTANDPRAVTIPGTEDDLDESMLLAPMVHEDECLGVAGPREARPATSSPRTTCGCS